MRARFTQSFKIQAVEKALERANDVSVQSIADDLGVGHSTLSKWITLARKQKLEPQQDSEAPRMTKEKRPQDWSAEEKLNIARCFSASYQTVERGFCERPTGQHKGEYTRR